jgi:hypothetical protein
LINEKLEIMKTLHFLVLAAFMSFSSLKAQVSVNVNIGSPPVWAPANHVEAQYYFLPDIDAYYDVPAARFIYIRNGAWYRSAHLPDRCRNYNLRGGNIVYLTDYRGNAPYTYYKAHKIKYKKRGNYYEVRDHDNGKHKGHGKGKGKGKGKHH